MKKKLIYSFLVIIGLVFIGSTIFVIKFYPSLFEQKQLQTQILNFKFLLPQEQNSALKEFNATFDKVKVVKKYQNLNNKFGDFNKNKTLLINPSAIKNIGSYQPSLIEFNQNLTKNAQENSENKVAKIQVKDLKKIINDAKKNHINLQINSAYRSFNHQKEVKKQLNVLAAVPGESEHQSGLGVDFAQEGYDNFGLSPAYKWMLKNAYKYGYILSFPKNTQKLSGEGFEQWHWRYIGLRYAYLFKQEQKQNKFYTFTNFIAKYFGYQYVSNAKYKSIKELIKQQNIANLIFIKNNEVAFKLNNQTSWKTLYGSLNKALDLILKNKHQYDKTSLFVPINSDYDNNFNIELKPFTLHDFIDDNLETLDVNKIKTMLRIGNFKFLIKPENFDFAKIKTLNKLFYHNKSDDLSNVDSTQTWREQNTINSICQISNNSFIIIRRLVHYQNSQELLKQRDVLINALKFFSK